MLAASRGGEPQTADVKPFELAEVTLADLQQSLSSGKYTARSLAEKYLGRIAEIDTNGPGLNTVIELNPDALAIADALDAERKSKGPRGPLHGIPVLIKDNIGTADRMMTTAGSLALLGFTPPKDSGVARRLRDAGALILGKTNLSEWANIRSSHSSSGWSGARRANAQSLRTTIAARADRVRAPAPQCPRIFARWPWASETDGSIVCPSSANGIVGIKPTVGLVSRAGIIPIAHSQDTAGPDGPHRGGCGACCWARLRGRRCRRSCDQGSGPQSRRRLHEISRSRRTAAARGLAWCARLTISTKAWPACWARRIDAMKHEGAVLVDPVKIESLGKFDDSELDVLLYEFKHDLNAYLASAGPQRSRALAKGSDRL